MKTETKESSRFAIEDLLAKIDRSDPHDNPRELFDQVKEILEKSPDLKEEYSKMLDVYKREYNLD